jgi:hypothetical protein
MKKLLLILSFLLMLPVLMLGQQDPFQVGEKAVFTIHYGLITGGSASFELKRDTFAGKMYNHCYFKAQTTGIADAFYNIKDIYESYFDTVTLLPDYAIRNVVEGHYKRYNTNLFDRSSRKDSAIITSNLKGKHNTQKDIFDLLSMFYYFRKNWFAKDYQFTIGEIVTINTWFCDEFYPIRLIYVGMEEVKIKPGKIMCYKFNPATEVGRVFKTNEDVTVWFSADKNYLPVKMRFDIFVGAFTAELQSVEGLIQPLGIKQK